MAENSKIAWTTHSFNPWIGCSKVSEGCRFCYAENMMDHRYGRVKWGPDGTRSKTSAANWKKPLKWEREAIESGVRPRVFCASLADVFEDRDELKPWRWELVDLVYKTPHLDWLFLTKRIELAEQMLAAAGVERIIENLWIGASIENQKAADERLAHLNDCRLCVVRFVSAEPLLGTVDLRLSQYPNINWVIAGCESNGKATGRFAQGYEAAARQINQQCRAAGVAMFNKQMPVGNMISDDPNEFPEDLRTREFPNAHNRSDQQRSQTT